MKKIKTVVLLFGLGFAVMFLVGCNQAQSLDEALISDTGIWDLKVSDGRNFTVTFFDDGNITSEQGYSSEEGKYKIDGKNIIIMNENEIEYSSLNDVTLSGNVIKGKFVQKNIGEPVSFTMTKAE